MPQKNEQKSSLRASRRRDESSKKVSFSANNVKKESAKESAKSSSSSGRRVSLRLFSKRDTLRKSKNTSPIDDKEDSFVEVDPVIELLEARTTQRVRFDLDGITEENPNAPHPAAAHGAVATDRDPPAASQKSSRFSVKNFMSRNLFNKGNQSDLRDEMNDPDMEEVNKHSSMIWKSAAEEDTSDFVHTSQSKGSPEIVAFTEDPKTRAQAIKLLNKGRRAQHKYFMYDYAVKCHVKALEILNAANYPDDHPTMVKTVESLNSAHHALNSYVNSAKIVKIGIRCEDSGDLVRALKMYTIAYRIRRDSLSPNHPSLVVLLNILGSIQVKRGELHEAMQVFELACKDAPPEQDDGDELSEEKLLQGDVVARCVTYREMAGIHEKLGNQEEAVRMYHKSLECAKAYRELCRSQSNESSAKATPALARDNTLDELNSEETGPVFSLENLQVNRSCSPQGTPDECDAGGMEVYLRTSTEKIGKSADKSITDFYGSFFPPLDDDNDKKTKEEPSDDRMDIDIALTLHQIAQMYRRQGHHGRALDAYDAALRGMKHALGPYHPNVAAILGNMGNLQNEMGDFDSAYDTYQEVLGIESYRLGFSHPEVAISIHNIATIEAARGNFDHSLSLYSKVLALQKTLYGEEHQTVAVTASCMGDVHMKLNDVDAAMGCYEESCKIKTLVFGRHHLEVARMLHKMGKVAFQQRNYNLADSYISRAFLLYRMNRLGEDHEWVVDAYKDGADVDAAIVMGAGDQFEC